MRASRTKIIYFIAFSLFVCAIGPYSINNAVGQTAGKTMKTSSGLQITDITEGKGATPRPGQICVMHYTGWLYVDGKKTQKFDSSVDRGQPFEFPIGQNALSEAGTRVLPR